MDKYTSRRLSEIKNDFERGVFQVVYDSRKQRWHRSFALMVLIVKHVSRGLLFSWPLYLLALAAYSIPDTSILLVLFLLLPAMYVSWAILSRGVREDYENLVHGYLLRTGYIGRIIFHGKV
ncbi:MAG: hypothetical protein KAJ32_04845 [Gammaproteobacteria bacterium]|nr:hypothetical protein [Gammaproteobacteria bacterium]